MNMVVNSVAYRNGQRIGNVTLDDISEVMTEPNTFVWLGLHEPDQAMLAKMREEFSLHELAIEDALTAHQRPKVEAYGESLFIVLKTAQWIDGKVCYGETHIFAGSNFVMTVRHGPSSGYQMVRNRCEEHPKMLSKGPGYVLYSLIDFVVDNYLPIVANFEKNLDDLEADIFKGQFDRLVIEKIYDQKRDLLELRAAALPITDICNELVRFHENLTPKELKVFFRDIQDHITRIVGALDNMREMLNTALQVNLALVGVGQNEIVKQLAGWGAILALPTLVFSLYGMNFQGMPELKWEFGYPLILGLTALGCVLLYWKLKKTDWI